MITATKEFTFDCAHMLSGHDGLCQNLHGHTYKLQVTLSLPNGRGLITDVPSQGMVLDFKDLKCIVEAIIINKFDHAFITWIDGNETEQLLAEICSKAGMRVVCLSERPTAENMAQFFFRELQTNLSLCRLESIKLWETPTSYVETRR